MANRSKQKGDRGERKLVAALVEIGCTAQRVPLSGAAEGAFSGDVRFSFPWQYDSNTAEVKVRANGDGWKEIERWLGSNDLLALYRDREPPLIVMPWEMFAYLVRCGNGSAGDGKRTAPMPALPEGPDLSGALGRRAPADQPVPGL